MGASPQSGDVERMQRLAYGNMQCPSARSPFFPHRMTPGNLFADSAVPATGERFEELLRHRNLVVERIVSARDAMPTEFVQAQDEWVLLVRGDATLEVAGQLRELNAGDYLFLPAGMPHTVRRVSDGALWLAVHLHPDPPAS